MGLLLDRSVALPEGARLDLAFNDHVHAGNLVSPATYLYRTSGDFYEIVQSIHYVLVTGASVGNRIANLAALDPDSNVLWEQYANGQQTASQTMSYEFLVDVGSAIFIGGQVAITPLPFQLLLPGYFLNIRGPLVPGDQIQALTISFLRIPTGPAPAGLALPPALPAKI